MRHWITLLEHVGTAEDALAAKAPKPENISGYWPYRMDAQPGDWLTY
jgi:hypothetical protein